MSTQTSIIKQTQDQKITSSLDSNQQNFNKNFRSMIGLFALFNCILTLYLFIHLELTKPYMDEQFHIDQLHAYCAGNFSYVSLFFI